MMNDQALVRLTDSAARYFSEKIALKQAKGIRLSVRSSGCSGFRYVMDFVTEDNIDDIRIDASHDVVLYLDAQCQHYLQGTVVDCVEKHLGQHIEFQNPNASNLCGCGESFSLKEGQADD